MATLAQHHTAAEARSFDHWSEGRLDESDLSHIPGEAGLAVDPARFGHEFALVALQRKLKDAGRFVFIDRAKRNPDFLRFVPDSLGYVGWALELLPQYGELAALLRARLPEVGR